MKAIQVLTMLALLGTLNAANATVGEVKPTCPAVLRQLKLQQEMRAAKGQRAEATLNVHRKNKGSDATTGV